MKFSDGTPFSADDVAFTMKRLMDPETHSPTADAFRSSDAPPRITVSSPLTVSILFGAPVAGLERLFDQVAITSAKSPAQDRGRPGAVLPWRSTSPARRSCWREIPTTGRWMRRASGCRTSTGSAWRFSRTGTSNWSSSAAAKST